MATKPDATITSADVLAALEMISRTSQHADAHQKARDVITRASPNALFSGCAKYKEYLNCVAAFLERSVAPEEAP